MVLQRNYLLGTKKEREKKIWTSQTKLFQTWTETYNNLYTITQSPQTFPLSSPPLPTFPCLVKCEFHFPFHSFFSMFHFFFNSPLHFKELEDTGGGMDAHLLSSYRDYRPNLTEHEEFLLCLKLLFGRHLRSQFRSERGEGLHWIIRE